MLKKLFLLTMGFMLLLLYPSLIVSQTQNNVVYFGNQKYEKVTGTYAVEFSNGLSNTFPGKRVNSKYYIVNDTSNLSYNAASHEITPAFKTESGEVVYLTNRIIMEFKDNVDSIKQSNLVNTHNLSKIKATNTFHIYSTNQPFFKSEQIINSGLVKYCHPDFIVNIEFDGNPPNDTYFDKQFYLDNTGQSVNGISGNAGADINVLDAWDITTGSNNVTIAVLDQGVTDNHPDLPSSRQVRLPGSDFVDNDDDPSPSGDYNHGNACAGVIAATQNNNEGISGVCPNCKIMPIRIGEQYVLQSQVAGAIQLAYNNGADVISNSYSISDTANSSDKQAITEEILHAIEAGSVVVFSGGNNHPYREVRFPGTAEYYYFHSMSNLYSNYSMNSLITVGASGQSDTRADYSPKAYIGGYPLNNGMTFLDIVATSSTNISGLNPSTNNVWTLDMPGNSGYNPSGSTTIPDYGPNNKAYTGIYYGGTSASAALVSGVVGLMLSENPDLGPWQVRDILINTADKIGNYDYDFDYNHWDAWPNFLGVKYSEETGFGKINAAAAVDSAQAVKSSNSLDLFVKARYDDLGIEAGGVIAGWPRDNSPDIWVSKNIVWDYPIQGDADFDNNDIVSVYVRVRNKSSVQSSTNMEVSLYARPKGSNNPEFDFGNNDWVLIGTKDIPQIDPGGNTKIEFDWHKDNAFSGEDGACLLALIDGLEDPLLPLTSTSDTSIGAWIKESNNVALKNVTVVYTDNGNKEWRGLEVPPGGALNISNSIYQDTDEYDFVFGRDPERNGRLLDEAEINMFVTEAFWNVVDNSPNIEFNGIEVMNENNLRIVDADASINQMIFNDGESVPVYIGFNFYGEGGEDTESIIMYSVKQRVSEDEEGWTGNVHYKIIKGARDEFYADGGGDIDVFSGKSTMLSGNTLNENADYNWYSCNDSLLSKSNSLSITPKVSGKYIYEIIAKSDGFKSYDTVFVKVNPYAIISLAPNPATSQLEVKYVADKAKNAKITIQMTGDPKIQSVYTIDPQLNQKTINVSSLSKGVYSVILRCDGKQVDSKTLLIQ